MGRGGSLLPFLWGRELACTDILAFTLASKGREVFLNGYSARVTLSATRRTKHRARSMAPPDISTITRSYELHLRFVLSSLVPRASPPPAPALWVGNKAPFLHIAKRGIFRCMSIQPSFLYIEPCALRLMHPWFNFPPLFLSTCSMQNWRGLCYSTLLDVW